MTRGALSKCHHLNAHITEIAKSLARKSVAKAWPSDRIEFQLLPTAQLLQKSKKCIEMEMH
jgi:hypothetical protein